MKVFVKTVTNAKKDEVILLNDNRFKVKVTDLPIQNKANKKIIKLISKYYAVSKSSVSIIKGHKNSNKVCLIAEQV